MKISIITVCWNSAATIEKTIQSVASQTYDDIEYIIVDGKSKDSTLDIVKKYPDTVKKWISEPDRGLYDAMNKGIRMATGDYIGIVNADDTFFDETVIQQIADFVKEHAVEVMLGDIVQHNEAGKVLRRYSAKKWLPEKLKIGFMPAHPAMFVRRDVFDRVGAYRLDFKIGADYEWMTRAFLKQGVLWKYSGITTHKMLIGGVSSSGWKSYKKVSEEIKKALQMNNISFSPFRIDTRVVWKVLDFI